MTLLAETKLALRVVSDVYDQEVRTLIDAALYDMERVGVNPALLDADELDDGGNAFVKHAVLAYCKANFGYDVSEAGRFDDAYRRIVCDLLNSAENIAAWEEDGDGLGQQAASAQLGQQAQDGGE